MFESRELDLVSVKGRAAPVAIHEVFLDLEGEALDRARRLAEAFAPALASYRRREWADAIAGFLACLELVPGDVAAAVLLKRSDHFRNNPPTDGWDGSFTMDHK